MSLGVINPAEVPQAVLLSKRETSDSRRIALLLLAGALPYLATLRNGFIYDDFQQILDNPYIHSYHHLGALLGSTAWSFQGAEGGLNYYRPLMSILFVLCWSVSGPIPLVYHLFNIAFHSANVAMAYWVTRQLGEDADVALTAAAIFALHPIHTESVAWISGVSDLQLCFFYLLAFGLYVRARGSRASPLTRGAMLASFAMALLSKESAITLPLVVLVYEHFFAGDVIPESQRLGDKVRRYGPLWAVAGVYVLVRGFLLGGPPRAIAWHAMNLRETVLSGIAAAGLYLGKLVWPANLHLTYPFHKSVSVLSLPVLAGVGALCVWALLAGLLRRHARVAAFGVVWVALTIAPLLDIRIMPTPFAERYLYLPSVGFCWLLACGFVWTWRELSHGNPAARIAFGCAAGIAAVMCVVGVEARNLEWRDQKTFVVHEVRVNPNAPGLHDNLGSLDWQGGDAAAAEREWDTALSLDPQDDVALTQLASLRNQQKRYADAADLFQRAVRIRPRFVAAHLGLGKAYAEAGDKAAAESEFKEAVGLAPMDAHARNLLGQLLYDEKRWNEAEAQFRASFSVEPSQQSCDRLGDLAFARGDSRNAIRDYSQAVALEPFDGHAHIRLGDLYAAIGQTPEAVLQYQGALATNPNDAHALTALHKLESSRPTK